MFTLDNAEKVALYKLLKLTEEQLGNDLLPLLFRIERELYRSMSIEEVEGLVNKDSGPDVSYPRGRAKT